MAATLKQLENRVIALEKALNKLIVVVDGSASRSQISQLSAIRQAEINDLITRVDALELQFQIQAKSP